MVGVRSRAIRATSKRVRQAWDGRHPESHADGKELEYLRSMDAWLALRPLERGRDRARRRSPPRSNPRWNAAKLVTTPNALHPAAVLVSILVSYRHELGGPAKSCSAVTRCWMPRSECRHRSHPAAQLVRDRHVSAGQWVATLARCSPNKEGGRAVVFGLLAPDLEPKRSTSGCQSLHR